MYKVDIFVCADALPEKGGVSMRGVGSAYDVVWANPRVGCPLVIERRDAYSRRWHAVEYAWDDLQGALSAALKNIKDLEAVAADGYGYGLQTRLRQKHYKRHTKYGYGVIIAARVVRA